MTGARRGPVASSFAAVLLVRYRLYVIALAAAARGVVDGFSETNPDAYFFATAGTRLLSREWADVFSDERVQAGVAQLIPYGVMARVVELADVDLKRPLTVVVETAFVIALVLVVRAMLHQGGRSETWREELFVAGAAIVGGLAWRVATSGHFAEGFIPLLWLLAARDVFNSRHARAGALIGLATGFKLLGLLGLPLLLLVPQVRKVVRGAFWFTVVAAILYGPFLLLGDVNTSEFEWTIQSHSPLRFLFGAPESFTWAMRLAQGILVAGAGAGLALWAGRRYAALWAVPLGIIALRLAVDPLDFYYYWIPVGVIALVGGVTLLPERLTILHGVLAASFYATVLPFFWLGGAALAVWITVASLSLMLVALVALRAQTHPTLAAAAD